MSSELNQSNFLFKTAWLLFLSFQVALVVLILPAATLNPQHSNESNMTLTTTTVVTPSNLLKQLQDVSSSMNKENKQGILELPKQAALVIRNYIDKRLQYYLNVSVPKPDPAVPPELNNSILGHLLLGHLFATPIPARPFRPGLIRETIVEPIVASAMVAIGNNGTSGTTTVSPDTTRVTMENKVDQQDNNNNNRTKRPLLHYHKPEFPPPLGTTTSSANEPIYFINDVDTYWIPDGNGTRRPSVILPILEISSATSSTAQPQSGSGEEEDGGGGGGDGEETDIDYKN